MAERKIQFLIQTEADKRPKMQQAWEMVNKGLEIGPVVVTLSRPNRTIEQNNKLWPMLTDIAKQVVWYGQKYSKEDWKDMITSALIPDQRVAPGLNGGVVLLGMSTSRMNKKEFSDLIELINAFGAQQGVQWSEKALECYENYREAQK
jgi:hypothetical protein